MANKRQQKKQQKLQTSIKKPSVPKRPNKATKQKINEIGQMKRGSGLTQFLKEAGFTPAEVREVRSWKASEIYYKAQAKERARKAAEKQARNKEKLIKAGYTPAEANKLKRKGAAALDELINQKAGGQLYLLGFVRDKTGGNVDAIIGNATGEWSEAVYWQKQMAKGTSISTLLGGIHTALEGMDSVGNIGEYALRITTKDQINNDTSYYGGGGYFKIYQGQGKNYKNLVSYIDIMMSFLYLQYERDVFIQELIRNLRALDNSKAHANADRLEEEFL